MARRIEVEILGNSADLERAFSRAGRSAKGFNRDLSSAGRGAVVASVGFKGLGRSIAVASGAFLGTAGLAVALKSTIGAAMEAQKVQAQLANVLEQQGKAVEENTRAIDARSQALSQMSGFDDELVTTTFTGLLRRTNDVTEAFKLNAIAVDVARGRNISLQAAAQLVTKASLGMAGSLRRVGIEARTGASAVELLDLLQRKFAGSAEAYGETAAGAQERFRVALENTQEIIGQALLPSLTQLLNKATEWLNKSENQERIQRGVNDAAEKGARAAEFLADSYNKIVKVYKDIKDADPFDGKSIRDLAAFGRAELPGFVDQLLAIEAASRRVAAGFNAIEAARIGMLSPGTPQSTIEGLRISPPVPQPDRVPSQISGTGTAGRLLTRGEQLAIALAGDPDNVALLQEQRARAQRTLDFALKMIQERRGKTADFAAAAEREAGRIAAINSRLAGISAENARSAEAARDRIRDAQERERQAILDAIGEGARGSAQISNALAKARAAFPKIPSIISGTGRLTADQRTAQQFAALGLGPTGETLAPTRKALIDEVARIEKALQGTFLDTNKTGTIIAGIRKALKLGLGGMADDVRATVNRLLDDLSGQLGDRGPLTRAAQASSKKLAQQLTSGLGLSGDALRQLRHNIVTANLTTASPQSAPAGGQVRIDNRIHIGIDGRQIADTIVTHTSKAKRRSVTQTSGRNAGNPNRFG